MKVALPQFLSKLPKLSRRQKIIGGSVAGLALAAWTGVAQVNQDEFGLRENAYVTTGHELLDPGVYFQVPLLQYMHRYGVNTQRIEFNAGGCYWVPVCDSTKDRNPLAADMVINYRVKKDFTAITQRRWEMARWFWTPNGYFTITGFMNNSANAILGQQSMAESLNDPDGFAKKFYADLQMRIAQNNVPIEIESIELRGFKTWYVPTRQVSYERVENPHATKVVAPPALR